MIAIECKTKKFEFEINDGSQSVMVVNIKDVSKEEMERDLKEFTDKYQIKTVTDFPIGKKVKGHEAPHKGIPIPLKRLTKELTDLPEEFNLSAIGDLFEKEGYTKKNIMANAYHDIVNLIAKNKIIYIDGTKPKKYRIVSRDTSDLE
jgi:hypothetical protein